MTKKLNTVEIKMEVTIQLEVDDTIDLLSRPKDIAMEAHAAIREKFDRRPRVNVLTTPQVKSARIVTPVEYEEVPG